MLRTIGLMSGTSLDGVDAAWVETDGERIGRTGPALTLDYDAKLKRDLRALLNLAEWAGPYDPLMLDCTRRLTERHIDAVAALRAQVLRTLGEGVDLIGLHGQTILHRPQARRTWQIGDAKLLAHRCGVDVAYDFRSADVAAGGQGAPLVPIVHGAMAEALPKPLAILNIGGVANLTWLGKDGTIVAFDTGPGNGPLDDWTRRKTGADYDVDGRLALAGQPDGTVLGRLMAHDYLTKPYPKSLDRLEFDRAINDAGLDTLSTADGAATLAAFSAVSVAAAARLLPEPPLEWLVCGGGRLNPALMRALAGVLEVPVRPVEVVGWQGDAIEAQAFGVLAARVVRGLPLTFPGTTGVAAPMQGGRVIGGLL